MNPTNDTVTLELENTVTGKVFKWKFREDSVPANAYINMRIANLREKYDKVIETNNVPQNDEGLPDYDNIGDELAETLSKINQRILKAQMDQLCSILTLVDNLPQGYESKRELLEECIVSYDLIPKIMSFFSKHSSNSIASPEDISNRIRFRKSNGEEFDPFPEKQTQNTSAKESSSTG